MERTSDLGPGDVIEEEYGAAFAAGDEIDLEPELIVMNHDWPRTGDRAREHLVAGVDERPVDEVEH